MTLITITHMAAPESGVAAGPHLRNHHHRHHHARTDTTETTATMRLEDRTSHHQTRCTTEPDRFSLNSNLSVGSSSQHSPHSNLTSPMSTDSYEIGSHASSICYPPNVLLSNPAAANNNNNNININNSHKQLPLKTSTLHLHHDQHHNDQHNQRLSSSNNQLSLIAQSRLSPSIRREPISLSPSAAGLLEPRSKTASTTPESRTGTVRRLSRIEHRQSLSDLGYGKIESYFKLQRLGKGTYATVYMGRSRLNNDLVALKEILKEHDEGAPCTAIREVSLLRNLRHNNIVTLHDICHTPKKLTLVFEYVGPDLYAYMKENNHLLSIHNVRLLLYQLLRGVAHCHSRQVLHRDLKPQNLLINSRGELKICDFGLARAKSIPTKSYSNEVVTLWYRPPDVLLGSTDYDHSIDMWGVGCIFFEMSSGRTLFPGSSVRQQLYLIFGCLGAPNRYNWPEVLANPDYQRYNFPPFRPEKMIHRVPRLDIDGMNLLMKFLRYRPSERISANQAKRDPFFACLPEKIHHLKDRESIFEVPGVYMTMNPGQKLGHM